jgi:hypothetical protein
MVRLAKEIVCMIKKHTVCILLPALIVLTLAAVLIWFFSPGIHIIGPFVHADIQVNCMLLNADDFSFVEETTFALTLTAHGRKEGELNKHNGTMELEGFPVEYDLANDGRNGFAYYDPDSGLWRLSYACPTPTGDDFSPTRYEVIFFRNTPDQMIIEVYSEKDLAYIAVVTNSPKEAVQIYSNYQESHRNH